VSAAGVWRGATLVAGKDLRIELRARVALQQILPFGAIVIVLFAFALDPDRGILPTVAPGLFWVAMLLATLLAVSRSFSVEAENGARDGLRLSGIDGASVFLGKATAVALELAALAVLLLLGVVVLYDVSVESLLPAALAAIAAVIGLASAGTVYGAVGLGTRMRETLVPLLVLPAVAPVALGGTRAFEWAFEGDAARAWPWVQLLFVFAAVYVTIGVLAFGTLLEES
jgi:heme exporter protein B